MKKITKIAVGITLAASLVASAGALSACNAGSVKTGEAYGLVHTGAYVGYAKITVDGDKVTDLYLTEVCLPSQVKVTADVADEDKVGDYYKTVTYGSVTLTYSAESDAYMVGTTLFTTYLQDEENAKAYYDAAYANEIKVTVSGESKSGIMTYNKLCKETNGYWTNTSYTNGTSATTTAYSRWTVNRNATVKYVLTYGVDRLTSLTLSTEGVVDEYGKSSKYWMDGEINTGATWADLNSDTSNAVVPYLSYAQLILNANEAAK